MKIKDKLNFDQKGLIDHGAITIVAFGDSVTHGALRSENDYETAYWNLLKQRLNKLRNFVPVNVINSGIGGVTASRSLARLERDVLSHHPDLIIVCFGLNDVNYSLEIFTNALEEIFRRCTAQCEQVIYLTPNMLNTYVAEDTPEQFVNYAATTAEYQNSGKMDLYIDEARAVARKCGVSVCDAYAHWKALADSGVDTTMMLSNRINHPTREMHKLFADMLFDMVVESEDVGGSDSNVMFNKENNG